MYPTFWRRRVTLAERCRPSTTRRRCLFSLASNLDVVPLSNIQYFWTQTQALFSWLTFGTVSLAPPAVPCRHRASACAVWPVWSSLWRIQPSLERIAPCIAVCCLHRLHPTTIPDLVVSPTGFSSISASLSARYYDFPIVQRCGPQASSPPASRASRPKHPSMLTRTAPATENLQTFTAVGARLGAHCSGRGSAVRRWTSALGTHAR